jgi:ribosome-associated toxin RatA of RatAB toxin-antitoxin module
MRQIVSSSKHIACRAARVAGLLHPPPRSFLLVRFCLVRFCLVHCLLVLPPLLLTLHALPARAYEAFSIEAASKNGAVELHVQARVQARHAAIWSTLTDYDRLSQFVPCIRSSRVLERRGNIAVVEQKGRAQVLFFSYAVEVTVESLEGPPDTLGVRVLKGNLKQLEGAYRLTRVEGSPGEYILSWSGVIEPDFSVPAFITVPLMRASFRDQFLAMVKEIERREAALAMPVQAAAAPGS